VYECEIYDIPTWSHQLITPGINEKSLSIIAIVWVENHKQHSVVAVAINFEAALKVI